MFAGVDDAGAVAASVVAVAPVFPFGAIDFGQLVGEVVGIGGFLAAAVDDFGRLQVAVVGEFDLAFERIGVRRGALHRVVFDFPDVFAGIGDLDRQAVGVVGVFGHVAFGRRAGEQVAE